MVNSNKDPDFASETHWENYDSFQSLFIAGYKNKAWEEVAKSKSHNLYSIVADM